ncbi:MAG: Tetratricopeptide repeat, partial [Candidatus Binataceae bacterium]|nr:Tetratricopeptide repeat [Candidatus Binataceae bacterium]
MEIPPSAFAMGAYLKAEFATESGDRKEALKQYEDAVKFDPHNAALHVQIATLYVRDGRLKEALEQAKEAIALDGSYARARLLAAG